MKESVNYNAELGKVIVTGSKGTSLCSTGTQNLISSAVQGVRTGNFWYSPSRPKKRKPLVFAQPTPEEDPQLTILFAVDSDSAFEVAGFTERTYWIYAGGQYFELGNVGTVDWRVAGDPRIPLPTYSSNVTFGPGTLDLDFSISNEGGGVTVSAWANASHIANAIKYDYSANVAASSPRSSSESRSRAFSSDGEFHLFVRVLGGADSFSTSGSYVSSFQSQSLSFEWQTLGSVEIQAGYIPGPGTASGAISLSDIQVAYQERWNPWLYVNDKQWIAWVFVSEDLKIAVDPTAEYQESRFYGWTGRKSSVSSTKVYGRRAYQDGSFTYAEATTDAELIYSSTPVTLSDFFENEKSWRLAWDGGSTSNPCESIYSGGTDNLVGTTLYRASSFLSTILSHANGGGGDITLSQYTATSNGSCTIELTRETTKSIPGGQSFDVCEAVSYYEAPA